MIFFCFSSKDRHNIVESIFYHVTNYSFPVWYDRHKMLMGDDRDYKNFIEGVEKNEYAVAIISPNAISSVCVEEEMELIFERHEKGEMTVFPIFYNIRANKIPEKYKWMTKLVYKEVEDGIDSSSVCNHIICKVLLDELSKYKVRSINEFLQYFSNKPAFSYITKLISSYCSVNDSNHNAQITLLYAACTYLLEHNNLDGVPKFYYEGVNRLFEATRLSLDIDLRETLIFERLFLLLFNSSISGYII